MISLGDRIFETEKRVFHLWCEYNTQIPPYSSTFTTFNEHFNLLLWMKNTKNLFSSFFIWMSSPFSPLNTHLDLFTAIAVRKQGEGLTTIKISFTPLFQCSMKRDQWRVSQESYMSPTLRCNSAPPLSLPHQTLP